MNSSDSKSQKPHAREKNDNFRRGMKILLCQWLKIQLLLMFLLIISRALTAGEMPKAR